MVRSNVSVELYHIVLYTFHGLESCTPDRLQITRVHVMSFCNSVSVCSFLGSINRTDLTTMHMG